MIDSCWLFHLCDKWKLHDEVEGGFTSTDAFGLPNVVQGWFEFQRRECLRCGKAQLRMAKSL